MTDRWDAYFGIVTAHEGRRVNAVDFSPDGRAIVSSGNDSKIRIWDVPTCTLLLVLYSHSESILSVKYSPDGARIVSAAGDCTVKIWDSMSGMLLFTLEGHTKSVRCAVFTPDGRRIISGSNDHSIKLWDAESGACLVTLTKHQGWVTSIAVSPNGLFLTAGDKFACGSGNSILVLDLASGEVRQVFTGHTDDVTCIAYNRDGTCIASGSLDGTVRLRYLLTGAITEAENLEGHSACLWDVATGQLIREFVGHSDAIYSVGFSLDGRRIATGSLDETVIIWDVATGTRVATCRGHYKRVLSVAFSPNGERVTSGGDDRRIMVWNAEGGELLKSFEGHTGLIASVAFAPGGDVIISSSNDTTMRFWDIETGACLLVLNPATWGSTVRLSPDGSGVLVDGERLIRLWAPLDEDAQAAASLPWLPRRTWPMYYIEEGWIFSLTPTRRTRLCWVPADWQGLKGYHGQNVLFGKRRIRVNFSALSSYLEGLRTDST
ncbi:uncharacterized protein PHACADRAFT_142939 [Phanerochaete carnosa HHB-10118-sp]|uniref:Uncharacterized protein n=1 Tax=Phanerochaete carnosa (strain HHB-10118-sp) TaxID=650164 RepID=K5WX54_PHACS|nr:uncharacterized protein PHACADRAFT_142939 [Phanerochaete carnosa HHB-10118-sp]EKM55062.1 hypothetical protein PHACADRAFT_142939 [Phanerochaete carnosa HHB-10118-sp]